MIDLFVISNKTTHPSSTSFSFSAYHIPDLPRKRNFVPLEMRLKCLLKKNYIKHAKTMTMLMFVKMMNSFYSFHECVTFSNIWN